MLAVMLTRASDPDATEHAISRERAEDIYQHLAPALWDADCDRPPLHIQLARIALA
jgi:hypothetical protein